MTNDHAPTEPPAWGGLEVASPSLGPRGGSAENGQHGKGSDGGGMAGNSRGGNGSGSSRSAGNGRGGNGPGGGHSAGTGAAGGGSAGNGSGGGGSVPPAPAERGYPDPDVLEKIREQVADFADFTHRGRAKLPDQLRALGSGGGITAQVVRTIAAEVIRAKLAPWLGTDEQTLSESLMLSLVAPGNPVELTENQRASFVVTRGQLMIDVSTAEVGGEEPVTVLVALPAPAGGGDSPPPAAAVIVGAATVANRPYVSLDRLMTHARRAIFEKVSSAGDAQNTGGGLRAARKLEIVVLLEPALGGGLWIDVNPATSLPEAALAIALREPPDRILFTHVLLPETAQQGMLAAGRATG
jgi:hypothetical protein